MGGRPKTAMAIFAFPLATMSQAVAVEVLQGASDAIAEAGAALVGGHTIDDDTMKFGLSVTGFVHPKDLWSNSSAREGDDLILTKPLGTGTLTAALKRGHVNEADIQDGISSMSQLNNVTDLLDNELHQAVSAATDITGFGLAGHAYNMANASKMTLRFHSKKMPVFTRALEFIAAGFLTKAHKTNSNYVDAHSNIVNVDKNLEHLLYDPQTSGGLLLAVNPIFSELLLKRIQPQFPHARIVGKVVSRSDKALIFE